MHFDDRLTTVLRLPPAGEGLARIQFRQLVDILGQAPDVQEASETIEAGFRRLEELGARLPATDRARLLRQPLQPISNPRLLAWLAKAEPDVACAAIRSARLSDEAWLALVPALPVRARGIMRHRRDLPPQVEALLERLGVRDRGLPSTDTVICPLQPEDLSEPAAAETQDEPDVSAQRQPAIAPHRLVDPEPSQPLPDLPTPFAPPTGDITVDQDMSEAVIQLLGMSDDQPRPTSLSEWARARAAQHHKAPEHTAKTIPSDNGIGAIVRRIEEFRKERAAMAASAAAGLGRAPRNANGIATRQQDTSPSSVRLAQVIDFSTDTQGRIAWADGPHAPSVVGLHLPGAQDRAVGGADIATIMRQRLPLRGARIMVTGAPAVSGAWQVDSTPRFQVGAFIGYCGRLRRPSPAAVPRSTVRSDTADADRMREVLHELRTPANAIQVAAEIIQQQLYGPAPHEYRALAAAIAGDCAHILAGFEELDRLVKLETGALPIEEGDCDLARVLAQTVVRLRAWTEPRGSGFTLSCDPSATNLPVGVARAEVERMVWRLLAALAGSTEPNETLPLTWAIRGSVVELVVAMPSVLAKHDPASLFDSFAGDRGNSLATGMFGIGFTLRLAAAELTAAGGALHRVGNNLHLSLPALSMSHAANDTSATISA